MTSVVLCAAPVMSAVRPSIALGLLQALLAERGVACRSLYLNLLFASLVGLDRNEMIAENLPTHLLVGDWLFADQLGSPDDTPMARAHRREVMRAIPADEMSELLRFRARQIPQFVKRAAELILAEKPIVVGFSTLFQQTAASLAIAAAVKRASPSTIVCFGGANCHGPMGEALLRHYRQIDYVFTGEADLDFPNFVEALLDGRSPRDAAAGFVGREGPSPRGAAPLMRLDVLPTPDYGDYFRQLAATPQADRVLPAVLFESSRGCWWGQKHHCTFCGLNAEGMTFREKSGPRVLRELSELRAAHGIDRFAATDNIMSLAQLKSVLPSLAEDPGAARSSFFYEIKSNLNREQLATMASAGVSWVQPGIESLSDEVLTLMDKGVSGLLNVRLLRNCRELGLGVTWSILYGFPGEGAQAYAEMARIAPDLEHLQPPNSCSRIRLDRFSPNFERAVEKGFQHLRPASAYGAVFAAAAEDLEHLAYFFEGEAPASAAEEDLRTLREAVHAWREQWRDGFVAPQLTLVRLGDAALVYDTRRTAVAPMHYLEPAELALLDRLRDPCGARQLLEGEPGDDASRRDAVLESLMARRLVMRHNGKFLALTVESDCDLVGRTRREDFPLGRLLPAHAVPAPPPAPFAPAELEGALQ